MAAVLGPGRVWYVVGLLKCHTDCHLTQGQPLHQDEKIAVGVLRDPKSSYPWEKGVQGLAGI